VAVIKKKQQSFLLPFRKHILESTV